MSKDPLARYAISDDITIGNVMYYGYIDKDNNWYIMKNDLDTGTYTYAKGNRGYLAKWDQKENITYQRFNLVF